MATEETTTQSVAKDFINTPLVALGVGEVEANANHVRFGIVYGLAIGWVLGLMRGKSAPDSNMLGIAQ